MEDFLNVAEAAFVPVLSANFAGATEARTVAGARGMRASFDGAVAGQAFEGYLYVVRGSSHFHALLAMYPVERADVDGVNVTGYVEAANIGDVH